MATPMRTAPPTRPAIPTARRGMRSVSSHQTPATTAARPTRATTSQATLRATKTMTSTTRTAVASSESRASARRRSEGTLESPDVTCRPPLFSVSEPAAFGVWRLRIAERPLRSRRPQRAWSVLEPSLAAPASCYTRCPALSANPARDPPADGRHDLHWRGPGPPWVSQPRATWRTKGASMTETTRSRDPQRLSRGEAQPASRPSAVDGDVRARRRHLAHERVDLRGRP